MVATPDRPPRRWVKRVAYTALAAAIWASLAYGPDAVRALTPSPPGSGRGAHGDVTIPCTVASFDADPNGRPGARHPAFASGV